VAEKPHYGFVNFNMYQNL